jgi:histidine triad (HIT) family protein
MPDRVEDCIFCKIVAGEFGTTFVSESDSVVAFDDISPQAPVHVLVVPKRHVASVRELTRDDDVLWGELLAVVNQAATERGIADSGYRLVANSGPDSGQEVHHLHLHVMGGGKLGRLG